MPGTCNFIFRFATGNPIVVGGGNLVAAGDVNREFIAVANIVCGLVIFVDANHDAGWHRGADACPGSGHGVGTVLVIVTPDDDDGGWQAGGFWPKISFHMDHLIKLSRISEAACGVQNDFLTRAAGDEY